ncbi:unnamed protein product [Caenorhabditis nigoni]
MTTRLEVSPSQIVHIYSKNQHYLLILQSDDFNETVDVTMDVVNIECQPRPLSNLCGTTMLISSNYIAPNNALHIHVTVTLSHVISNHFAQRPASTLP